MRSIRAAEVNFYEDNVGYDYYANVYDENILLSNVPHIKGYEDITDMPVEYLASTMPSIAKQKTIFTKFLEGSGRVRMVDAEDVLWRLKGTGNSRIKSLGNINEVECPGLGDTLFWFYTDDDLHVEGDVLAPLAAMGINIVLQSNAKPYGEGYKHEAQLAEGSDCDYVDPELFDDGQEWIKIDSIYGEASYGHGSHYHNGSSFVEFMATLTTYRKQLEVTDKANAINLRMRFCDASGNKMDDMPDRIITKAEAVFIADIKWEKELRKLVGASVGRSMIDPSSSYHRRAGAGIFPMMRHAINIPYNTEGPNVIDMMESEFQAVWLDRVDMQNRDIVVATGTAGLIKAQNDLEKKRRELGIVLQGSDYTRRGGTQINPRVASQEFPTQRPLKYNFAPWGSVTFEHWPILDSHYITGTIKHPITGLPASSYMYFVVDYGVGRGMGSNIELLKKRNSEYYTYICGTHSPRGPINTITDRSSFVATHKGAFYTLVYGSVDGIRVKDLTRLMLFRPSFC